MENIYKLDYTYWEWEDPVTQIESTLLNLVSENHSS